LFDFKVHKSFVLHSLIIFITTLIIFIPTFNADFVTWDDSSHVFENPYIHSLSLENIKAIFVSSDVQRMYMPLTVLSYAIDYHFVKLKPALYHLVNVAVHLAVLMLIYLLVLRLSSSSAVAFWSTLIFAIHPMHVEPVAWVTGRKDLLNAAFFLLALHAYWSYLEKGRVINLCWVFLCGILSMLAKPTALGLPFVLFLFDWCRQRKFSLKSLLEKGILLMSLVPIAWLTFKGNMEIVFAHSSLFKSILLALWSGTFYLKKFFFPLVLSPIYALPKPIGLFQIDYLLAVLICGFSLFIVFKFRKQKWVLFAFLYFFLSLFFLIRFNENLATSLVADRYMYLPSLGFCILLGSAINQYFGRRLKAPAFFDQAKVEQQHNQCIMSRRVWRLGLFSNVIVLMLLGAKAHLMSRVWQNSFSLWNFVIKELPDDPKGYASRGLLYRREGKQSLALEDFNKAIALDPYSYKTYNNRGLLFKDMREFERALADFNHSVELNPYYDKTYLNRGKIHKFRNEYQKSLDDFNKAIALNPQLAGAYLNRGNLYQINQQFELALNDYHAALNIIPDYPEVFQNKGNVFLNQGRVDDAIEEYEKALRLKPNFWEAHYNKALLHQLKGEWDWALESFSHVIKINEQLPEAYYQRAKVYIHLERLDEALQDATKAKTIGLAGAGALVRSLNQTMSRK